MRLLWSLLRRNADYRRLFLASVVSYLGDWFSLVAVSGLVEELTGAESSTALVFAAEVLPLFLLSPLAGVLADRMDRKVLMIGADVARVVPALGLVAASATGQAWLAYLCVVALSSMAAFFQPVAPAVVPNLVDGRDLSLANAAIGGVWGSMLFVGAALGGLAAATLGRDASFVLNAATFVVSAGLLLRIRRPFRADRPLADPGAAGILHTLPGERRSSREDPAGGHARPRGAWTSLGEVRGFARAHKVVRSLMVTKAGVGIGNGIVGLLPIYALDVFRAGDAGVGALLAARGLGALLGPFVGRRLARDRGRQLVLYTGLSIAAYAVAYLFLPWAPSLWVAFLVVTMAHLGGGYQWVASTHGLQASTPDALRGRVMSLDFGLATLGIGVSALVAAGLAELVGLRGATLVLAGCALAYALTWLAWTRDLWAGTEDPLPGLRHTDAVTPAAPPAPSTLTPE